MITPQLVWEICLDLGFGIVKADAVKRHLEEWSDSDEQREIHTTLDSCSGKRFGRGLTRGDEPDQDDSIITKHNQQFTVSHTKGSKPGKVEQCLKRR